MNTKIGPVLEVTTSYQQGKHGVEIRIEFVNKGNSHSRVRISHGLHKLVTDLIDKEYDDNEQETSTTKTEVFAFASRSKAEAKPKRPSTPFSSSKMILVLERKWIDIEPGAQVDQAYPVAKKNEHSSSTRRLTSRRRWRDRTLETERWSSEQISVLSKLVWWCTESKLAGGGGNKKRFQCCIDPSGQEILNFRALQGHSGRNFFDPTLQDNVLIPNNFFEYMYQIGCAVSLHSITNSGLVGPPPTIFYKDNGMKELDFDVARSNKDIQRIELKPNTQLSSTRRLVTKWSEETLERTKFDRDTLNQEKHDNATDPTRTEKHVRGHESTTRCVLTLHMLKKTKQVRWDPSRWIKKRNTKWISEYQDWHMQLWRKQDISEFKKPTTMGTFTSKNGQRALEIELQNVTSSKYWTTTRSHLDCETTCAPGPSDFPCSSMLLIYSATKKVRLILHKAPLDITLHRVSLFGVAPLPPVRHRDIWTLCIMFSPSLRQQRISSKVEMHMLSYWCSHRLGWREFDLYSHDRQFERPRNDEYPYHTAQCVRVVRRGRDRHLHGRMLVPPESA